MKLSFYGADQCVTGSCHCLDVNGFRILIDCGLQQGRDEVSNEALPFAANTADFLLVTHAHIDHTGRIPMLVKEGFRGPHPHHPADGGPHGDHAPGLRPHPGAGRRVEKPQGGALRRPPDGAPLHHPGRPGGGEVHDHLRVSSGHRPVRGRAGGVRWAGHLLGSASIIVTATEGGVTKRIVFSGDIGNVDQPIIRDPSYIDGADYVVMESTYGDRQPHGGMELHRRPGGDHRRDHRQRRQRGDPLLRRGPHPGAAVLHPGDQGTRGW